MRMRRAAATAALGLVAGLTSDEGCTWSEVADLVQPVDLFLARIDPVHVRVRARLTKDRYGARYDPVPVTIKGQEFVLMIE